MADSPKAPRVAVLSPDGQFGTVDATSVDAVIRAGGRVLSKKELAQRDADERYEAQPTINKVAGALGTAAAVFTAPMTGGLSLGGLSEAGGATPEAAALGAGVRSGATAGLSDAAEKKAYELVAGKDKARAFAETRAQTKEASPIAHGVGQAVGFTTGSMLGGEAAGAARLLPSAGISALGAGAENITARALSGLASKGVIGRALATGAEFAARGAVEGGLTSAVAEAGEQMLGDKDVALDKVFSELGHGALLGGVMGGALGTGGSLLASGGRAAKAGLARALSKAESPTLTLRDPDAAVRNFSNKMAFDALGATKTQAVSALEHVAGGAEAVGEYVNRIALKPAAGAGGMIGGAAKAGLAGRADQLLTTIQADKYGRVAEGLSNAVRSTDARINMNELTAAIDATHAAMMKDATKIAGADAFRNRITTELGALSNAGKVAADGTVEASDLFSTRAALERKAYEVAAGSGAAGEAYKGFLREMDNKIVTAIDQAAAKAGRGGVGDEIRHWKREWQLASAAEEAAKGGAERIAHNNIFGLREGIAAGVGVAAALGSDDPITGLAAAGATALGGRFMRQRGAAVGAALLGRIADMGVLQGAIKAADNNILKASKGLLSTPVKAALPEAFGNYRERADTAMRRVTQAQSDPDVYVEKVSRNLEKLGATAPELAAGLNQRAVDYVAFMAERMPTPLPPDPFNPRPAPVLSDQQARKFALYDWYWEHPKRFFDEVSHGKLTFEGIEVAKAAMPKAFAQLQMETAEQLATLGAQGKKPPFQQRQNLGALLDFAATPAQRPEHAMFLQGNVLGTPEKNSPPPARGRSGQNLTQRSNLDRLEADGVGRR